MVQNDLMIIKEKIRQLELGSCGSTVAVHLAVIPARQVGQDQAVPLRDHRQSHGDRGVEVHRQPAPNGT